MRGSYLRLVLALLLAATASGARTDGNAPFQDTVGLPCTSHTDCGYVPALACVAGKCEYCSLTANNCGDGVGNVVDRCQLVETLNTETGKMEPQFGWSSTGETVQAALCVEKDLFSPFTWNDVVATGIAFACTALGSGGGVGGGGLLVPMYISFVGLSPKHAIPLSKVTIFGSAVATYILNFPRKHPTSARLPVVDYRLAALIEPTTLLGTIFGVMMNHVFPDWLILVLLVSLLSFTTYKTFVKGSKIREKESTRQLVRIKSALIGGRGGGGRGRRWSIYRRFDVEVAAHLWLEKTRRNRKARQIQREDDEDFRSLPTLASYIPSRSDRLTDRQTLSTFGTFPSDDDQWSQRRQAIEKREMRLFPLVYIMPLVLAWLVVLVQSILRGGHGAPSAIGVACNSADYWMLTFLPLSILVGLALWVGHHLRLLNRLKVLSGYPFVEGDIHWTKRRVTSFPSLCVIAGVAAGLLGVGGGMVQAPIMLEVGILPAVQSATATYMILFTASSTTLQFAINGQFPGERQYDYMAWFAFIGCLGGFCGQKVVAYLVKKYKRESIMVYILAATIGLSAVAMGFVGLQSTLSDLEKGVHLGFHGICDDG